jgi:septal ring factor EnvC (AmiA/AmiB activator)
LYSIVLILAPPWQPSTTEDDKLSQILEHIKKLDRKVNVQDGVIARLEDDNATLKDDSAALKVRVGILEEDNQVLREAIDGVSTFA